MNGNPNTTMIDFKGQLSDANVAAVITYERISLGNSMGDIVQISEIKSLR